MDTASRHSFRSKASSSTGHAGGGIVLLTDELELAMGKLKAEAAERRAPKGMASPGWLAPVRSSSTESDSVSGLRVPGFLTPTRRRTGAANADSAMETASLPGGRTGPVPRASTGGEQAGGRGDAASVVSVPVTRRKSAGNGEDEFSAAAELAPTSPLSSRAGSQAASRYSAAYTDGAPVARLKHFDISAFSLASAPGSPQVSHAVPPIKASTQNPTLPPLPGSPDHAQGSCFTFITPKQVDGSVLSPVGWLVSLLCSYQPPVRERVQHLHVVRHAQRIDAANPAWGESADRPWDPPLSAEGKEEAYLVGARLRRENGGPHRVVCSPYLRCVETAAEIVKALMASDSEVAHRAAAAAAKAGPTPGVPVGAGVRSQAVNQMLHQKGAPNNGLQGGGAGAEGEGQGEGLRSGDGDARRGRRARGSRKVRAYIEPGLCEIRTATAGAASAPEAHPSDGSSLLLPREQLEGMLPRAALRPNSAQPFFEAPPWPEDVDQGLRRLLGAGDRICEQYSSDDIILVSHSEALHGSIMRCLKKAVVYNIRPAGYVHLERTVYEDAEDEEDRGVSPWKLVTRSGTSGVYFA